MKKKHDESSTHVLERSELWSVEEQPQSSSSSSSGKVCIIADPKKKKVCIIYLDIRHQKSAPEENEKF